MKQCQGSNLQQNAHLVSNRSHFGEVNETSEGKQKIKIKIKIKIKVKSSLLTANAASGISGKGTARSRIFLLLSIEIEISIWMAKLFIAASTEPDLKKSTGPVTAPARPPSPPMLNLPCDISMPPV